MSWQSLNTADNSTGRNLLSQCCGSTRWVAEMLTHRPFTSADQLIQLAHKIWATLTEADYLEAFTHHPRIGEKALREKFASTAAWASSEQSGVSAATDQILSRLATLNDEYFNKFGFIFIVCATGKSAAEMLQILESRLPNSRHAEIQIAAAEQAKITEIRLRKL